MALFMPFTGITQVINLGSVKDHCASSEEVALYNLINNYRRIHKLPVIPFSKSLSYVARIHAMDLSFNRPDFGGCNPHSWSAKGKWKPCCYAHDKNRLLCMNEKPKEISGYKSKGWEMVYSGGEEAKAIDAFDLWKGLGLTNDYLLNTGKWTKAWKALGIGFYGEYACVWFGEGDDPEKDFGPCLKDTISNKPVDNVVDKPIPEVVKTKTINADRKYHIIIGSLNNPEKANSELKKIISLGYINARIIQSGVNYRISVNEFATETEAQEALPAIQAFYTGAWVLKPDE
jgi:hypothetical protein